MLQAQLRDRNRKRKDVGTYMDVFFDPANFRDLKVVQNTYVAVHRNHRIVEQCRKYTKLNEEALYVACGYRSVSSQIIVWDIGICVLKYALRKGGISVDEKGAHDKQVDGHAQYQPMEHIFSALPRHPYHACGAHDGYRSEDTRGQNPHFAGPFGKCTKSLQ
mmetsp:Transcript_21863/g.52012  ORF Transcript_21863/g.52012 Transcript_21863/m.52012 type:complete len:162 (-) Transcript_21863:117-602(-)